MNDDEFTIVHCTIVGSENRGDEENYNLVINKINAENNGLSFDELVRLRNFLDRYITSKKGGKK